MNRTQLERSESQSGQGQSVSLERLVSVKEVAALLGISVRKVWRMIAAGQFVAPVRMGRSRRWPQSEIQQYVEELKQQRDRHR
jgi:excisionase family DNA binding protein